MIEVILTLGSFILVAFLFTKIKAYVQKRMVDKVKKTIGFQPAILTNSSIGNVYKANGEEAFQWKKFKKIFNLGSGIEWIKSIKEIMDLRKLTIYLLIAGSVFAYGWYQGKLNTPVQVNLAYDKEFIMDLNGEYLHKPKFSNDIYIKEDGTDRILKHIKAKDFPELKRKLAPIGFQLKPVGIIGMGAGDNSTGFEAGAGISWLRYWKWEVESFLTNKGIYPLGTSYRLSENSSVGAGAGKGYKGDNRVIFYYKWRF